MPEHESHSLRTCHWRNYYGIFASFKKIFLLPWSSESYAVWQRVANGGSRKRIVSYDRRMGQNEAKRVLCRQGYEMAIHYAPCPTSEWMLWSSGQVHKVRCLESHWRGFEGCLIQLWNHSWRGSMTWLSQLIPSKQVWKFPNKTSKNFSPLHLSLMRPRKRSIS